MLPLTQVLQCLRSARPWNFCQLCECVCSPQGVLQWKVLYNVKNNILFCNEEAYKKQGNAEQGRQFGILESHFAVA